MSITNVIKFEKTEQETLETFRKERRARARWYAEENDYLQCCPEATYEEQILAKKERAPGTTRKIPFPGTGSMKAVSLPT